MLYPVAIQQKDQVFYAFLPDIPSLKIQDSSMADTISTARELLMKHLIELVENEQPVPDPSDISSHLSNPKFAGWTWAIVNLDINRVIGDNIDISVTITQRLHQKLTKHLESNNLKMNDFIVTAIKEELS